MRKAQFRSRNSLPTAAATTSNRLAASAITARIAFASLVGLAAAETFASVTPRVTLFVDALTIIFGAGITTAVSVLAIVRPIGERAAVADTDQRERVAGLELLLERRTFDARLARALEATKTEAEVVALMTRAVEEIAPTKPTELLLVADGSSEQLTCASRTSQLGSDDGCPVATLGGCRAVQHGHTEYFDSSETIDACAHLRGRARGEVASVCVPMTVAGRNVGVLHVTSDPKAPATPDEIVRFEELATQAAARISLLRAVEHATEQAATDPLTGAANRRSLEQYVSELGSGDVQYAIAIADLDRFKVINDTYGHEAGDRTLKAFAQAMQTALRPDDLVARIGGDEFVLVMQSCRIEQANVVVERVRREFARTLRAAALPEASASFGLADHTCGYSLSTILAAADAALLEAKRAGRNQVAACQSLSVDDEPHSVAIDLREAPSAAA